MTKTLEQFKNETLGGTYGKPRLDYPGDNWYAGECVSYVRQYMEQVLGIQSKTWGNAVDYWTNTEVLSLFDKVSTGQDGDILVWGDDPGTWTGPAGHIAIKYGNQILNQNFGGSSRVTLNAMFTPGFLGYLRLKGGNRMNEKQATDALMAMGKLGMLPESVFTSKEWLAPRVGSAMADPGYIALVGQQLAREDPWKTGNYKAVHYDADIEAAREGGEYEQVTVYRKK